MTTTDKTATHFIVRALCLNEKGEIVTRDLGTVDEEFDGIGRLGWTVSSDVARFPTLAEARAVVGAVHPYYDGHYENGIIRILEIETRIVTTITTTEHPIND